MPFSPNRSPREGQPIKMVVIHGDAGKTDQGTVSWIMAPESKVSYHYLVGRFGKGYPLVPETEKAWHAGKSRWPGVTLKGSVNQRSIGVAFANDGEEPFKAHQVQAGAQLVADIARRHYIDRSLIRGHFEVSPGRKTDPWDHFPWALFWEEYEKERTVLG